MQIEFLDVFKVDKERRLQMQIYRNRSSINSLLHATSAHIQHAIKAVPVGQFLRMKQICSSEDRFKAQAKDLKDSHKEATVK